MFLKQEIFTIPCTLQKLSYKMVYRMMILFQQASRLAFQEFVQYAQNQNCDKCGWKLTKYSLKCVLQTLAQNNYTTELNQHFTHQNDVWLLIKHSSNVNISIKSGTFCRYVTQTTQLHMYHPLLSLLFSPLSPLHTWVSSFSVLLHL